MMAITATDAGRGSNQERPGYPPPRPWRGGRRDQGRPSARCRARPPAADAGSDRGAPGQMASRGSTWPPWSGCSLKIAKIFPIASGLGLPAPGGLKLTGAGLAPRWSGLRNGPSTCAPTTPAASSYLPRRRRRRPELGQLIQRSCDRGGMKLVTPVSGSRAAMNAMASASSAQSWPE